jgi:hypothetical protein
MAGMVERSSMYDQLQQQGTQSQPNQGYSGGLVMANGKPQQLQQQMTQMSSMPPMQQQGTQPQTSGDQAPRSVPQTQSASPAPAPAPPAAQGVPQSYGLPQFQQWAQTTFGRQANQSELGQIGNAIGSAGANGQYSQAQYQQAQGLAEQMARAQGWTGQSAQPAAPAWGQNPAVTSPVTGSMFGQGNVAVQAPQHQTYQHQNPYMQQQQQLMQSILGSGGSMNQNVQDSMFEQQKEQANSMAQQLGMRAGQGAAGRGFGPNGNANQGAQSQINDTLAQQLMGGRRDISVQAAQTNRQDQLNALNQSMGLDDQAFNQGMGQNQQAYGQNMGNAQFQYQQMQNDRGSQLQEWLAQRTDQLENRGMRNQEQQFLQSFLESQRQFNNQFGENQRQFNANLGENSRQYNGQMGFNYTNMNNNNQNSYMRYLMGG